MYTTKRGTPAHLVAKYCDMAYGNDRKLSGWKKVVAKTEKGCGGVLILSYETNELFVALRGTDSVSDWWRHNLRVAPKRVGDVLVHRGFYEAGNEAVSDLLDGVSESIKLLFRIVYCGHSLGGASAIAAAASRVSPMNSYELVTFGAPRALFPAARALVRATSKQTLQFGNESDIVFRVPPYLTGYRHAGDIKFISRSGKVIDESSPLVRKVDALKGLWGDVTNLRFDTVADHSIRRYEEALK